MAALAGVNGHCHSTHKSRAEALEVYTTAYFEHRVLAYPLPGSKYWTPALGRDCMRSVSMGPAPETLSSSSSAFWGHFDDDGSAESLDSQKQKPGNAGARSTAFEMQMELMGFKEAGEEDSD